VHLFDEVFLPWQGKVERGDDVSVGYIDFSNHPCFVFFLLPLIRKKVKVVPPYSTLSKMGSNFPSATQVGTRCPFPLFFPSFLFSLLARIEADFSQSQRLCDLWLRRRGAHSWILSMFLPSFFPAGKRSGAEGSAIKNRVSFGWD